ncbi:LOW QUALITY PROTEIN: fasciculation and elongation protein zeta-2 [Diretmus argenteus]
MAAPLAHFDGEWRDVSDPDVVSDRGLLQKGRRRVEGLTGVPEEDLPGLSGRFSPPGETGAFKSMEELVSAFDDNLSACFRNYCTETDTVAPVHVIAEDTLLKKDEIWNTLTDNYGKVMPVDWKRSRTRSLHAPAVAPMVAPRQKPRVSDVTTELSDDEELREQLDMHSIIVSCLSEEPLFTAEQVIEEIEEMMQDSPDMEAEQNPSHSDLSMFSLDVQRSSISHSYEERVRALSVAELNERLEETEATIRRFSEELVEHLALRDELDFEKEVKNSFISVLIDIQNRQKEHRELLKKKKKLKSGAGTPQGRTQRTKSRFSMEGLSTVIQNGFRHTFGSGCSERQYLTTVIPYEKKGHPPSIEDLQILTKILQAIRDDSDKVPSLLTDYILKELMDIIS